MIDIFSYSENRQMKVKKVIPVTLDEMGTTATDRDGKTYHCTEYSDFQDDDYYYGLGEIEVNGKTSYILYL